jgi:hypothetical protein
MLRVGGRFGVGLYGEVDFEVEVKGVIEEEKDEGLGGWVVGIAFGCFQRC